MEPFDPPPAPSFSRRRFLALASAAGGVLLLSACGGSATPAPPASSSSASSAATSSAAASSAAATSASASAAASGAPAKAGAKGTATVVGSERILTLDPLDHYSISSTYTLQHIYDPLLLAANDGKLVPNLAESWKAVDERTWEFKLRTGIKFHNGEELNAESVKATFERAMKPDSKLIKAYLFKDLEAIEVKDPTTVQFRSKTPYGSLPNILTLIGILPAKASQNLEEFLKKPAGTGPFKFVSWTRGDMVELEANKDYWKKDVVKLDRVTFRFIPEVTTRMSGLRAGESDVVDRVPPDQIEVLQKTPGAKVMSAPAVETQQWIFNMSRKPFDNPKVRQAISLGIDREGLIKELMLGHAKPATGFIPPGVVGHTDNLPLKKYDPEKAKALLKEAGFASGLPADVKSDFVLMKGVYTKQTELAQAVAAQLAQIGVKLQVRELEVGAAREARTAGDYAIFYSGWAFMEHDPDQYIQQWFTTTGSAKLNRFSDKEIDDLAAKSRTNDPAQRQKILEEIQQKLWDLDAAIWPYYSEASYGLRDRVQGFEARSDYFVLMTGVST